MKLPCYTNLKQCHWFAVCSEIACIFLLRIVWLSHIELALCTVMLIVAT